MKVFITWSGETSRALAEILRGWLPAVIQAIKPYYSPDDITKGSRWHNEISKELEDSRVGLICLTQENLKASWIMFEAGALSKNLDKSHVCPILFGIDPTDIKGPLVQFQASRFEKGDIKKVVKMINNELGDKSLPADVFDSVFEKWWPDLEQKVGVLLSDVEGSGTDAVRSDRDLIEEILSTTRSLSRAPSVREASFPAAVARDLIASYGALVREAGHVDAIEVMYDSLVAMRRPLRYVLRRTRDKSTRDVLREAMETIDDLLKASGPSDSGKFFPDELDEE